jgi:hypothetical protein
MDNVTYNIYGFVLSVEGPCIKSFETEYKRFKVDNAKDINLFVKTSNETEDYITKAIGGVRGIYVPFKEDENTLYYDPDIDSLYLPLIYAEALMNWEDKCFLHSGAVSDGSKAYVFTAEGGVGKTSTVLNLAKKGYQYLSDDWLIIGNGRAYPFPKTLHIFDYNLKHDKEIAKKLLGLKRFYYLPLIKLLDVCQRIPHRYFRFAFDVLKPKFFVDVEDLYPNFKVGKVSPISKVFYLERWNKNEVDIENMDAMELARRTALINLYERNYFFLEYYKYAAKYNITNVNIEKRFEQDIKIMYNTFKTTKVYKLLIPDKLNLSVSNLSFLSFDDDQKEDLL